MNISKMTKLAKILDKLAKAFGIIGCGVGIASVAFAVWMLVTGNRMNVFVLLLGNLQVNLTDEVWVNTEYIRLYELIVFFMGGIMCLMVNWGIRLVRRILVPMKEGRPFETEVTENLKKIAWLIFIGGLINQIVGIVENRILFRAYSIEEIFNLDVVSGLEYKFETSYNFIIVFLILIFMSYIFSYGQKLQRESDETL